MDATAGRLSVQLGEAIEERIATGEYAPGHRLDETELAEAFGVSRTPVREALIKLASSGQVELRPRRGAVVAEIAPHRLFEMFEVVAELESMCARLAAQRIGDDELRALVEVHEACGHARDAGDSDAYYRHNALFHERLYAASRNGFLVEQTSALNRRLRPYRRLQLRARGRLVRSFREHADIVDALVAGDAERAAQATREHVLVQGERFAGLVASLQAAREHGRAA